VAAATTENERSNRDFFREHAQRPSMPARMTDKERALMQERVAEYEAIQLASAAYKAGRYDEAVDHIAGIKGADRDINLLKFRARINWRAGRYDLAVEDYGKLLGLAKDLNVTNSSGALAQVYIDRARVYESARKFDLAEADLDQAAKVGGAYLDAILMHAERAELYLAAGKWQPLTDELTEVIKRFSSADRYARRGVAYFLLGDKTKAKADLDQATVGKSTLVAAWLTHAVLLSESGQAQSALDDCDYAIKTLNPKDASAHLVKGTIYLNVLKQPARAIEEFDAALQLDPNLKEAQDLRNGLR